MIERYTRPAMGRIWTEETKYRCWLQVEAAASTVLAEDGVIPAAAAEAIASEGTVSAARVQEIEAEVKHDVIAFTTAVAEAMKEQGPGRRVALAALRTHLERRCRHRAGFAGEGGFEPDRRRVSPHCWRC